MGPAFTPLILSIYKVAVHAGVQQKTINGVGLPTHEKVPGNNSAYYVGPPSHDQFFTILDFEVSPNRLQVGTSILLRLTGIAPAFANLPLATLHIRISLDGLSVFDVQENIDRFPGVMVRRGGQCGGPLKGGKNELLVGFTIPGTLTPEKKYTIFVQAKVHASDGEIYFHTGNALVTNKDVLFGFEGEAVLEN